MGILTILKNNCRRLSQKKAYLFLSIAMCLVSILLAVYFTTKVEFKSSIAYVPYPDKAVVNTEFLNIHITDKVPQESDIVLKKYDAIVIDKNKGDFDIQTIKNDDFKTRLLETLKHPEVSGFETNKTRGSGTSILGFLIMFLLIESLMFIGLFTEDKAFRTFKRIGTSPVPIINYLISQSVFVFVLIYIITFSAIIISGKVFGIDMGFSYFQYSYLVAILSLIATAYSLFMASVIEKTDNIFVMSSCIAVLTSILSGGFYAFGGSNSIWNAFIHLFPQKNYLDLLEGIEGGKALTSYLPQTIYLMVFVILFFAIAIKVCQKRLNNGRY